MKWATLSQRPQRVKKSVGNWTASIYGLVDPRDGTVRYVGATEAQLEKRLAQHLQKPTNFNMRHWIEGLRVAGLTPRIENVSFVPPAFRDSAELEWIAWIQARASLLNFDPGGQFRDEEGVPRPRSKALAGMYAWQHGVEKRTESSYFRDAPPPRWHDHKSRRGRKPRAGSTPASAHETSRGATASPGTV